MSLTSKKIKNLTTLALTTIMVVGAIYLTRIGDWQTQANNTAQTIPFTQNWTNVGLITANDDWSAVPGIVGFLGNYDAGSPTDVDPRTLTAPFAANDVDVIANQTNPDTLATGGVAEFEIANPTVALQGSGTADAPHIVVYLNTTGRFFIQLRYNARDIDAGSDVVQPINTQFRVGSTGDYSNLNGGYIADASAAGATLVTPVTVTLPPSAENQPLVEVRILTVNVTGSDEFIAIDDITVVGTAGGSQTPTPSPSVSPSVSPSITPTPVPEFDLTISQADAPDPVSVGQPLTYTLTVSIIPTALGGSARPVVRFNFPSGVPISFNTASGTNGYTATSDASGVTFAGGTISTSGVNAGTATLTVVVTPQAAGTLTSAGGNVVVDPNNLISESNENNNTAQTITTTITALPARGRLYDFNGNGTTDWTTLTVGTSAITWSVVGNPANAAPNAAFIRVFNYGLSGDTINAADYSGDLKTEISVWRSGVYYIAQFPTGSGGAALERAVQWGGSNDIAGREGDYDGDGKTDYTVVRTANNTFTFFIMSSGTNTMRAVQFGGSTTGLSTNIFPGADFTGDGRDELVISNSVGGNTVYSIGDAVTGAGVLTVTWGNAGSDLSVAPADYTGDGRADLVAVRQQSAGTAVWFIRNTATGAATGTQFGIGDTTFANNDLPVRGDYDGDGRHDIAVYRRSNNFFYVFASSNGSLIFQKAGNPGDVPLANRFVF